MFMDIIEDSLIDLEDITYEVHGLTTRPGSGPAEHFGINMIKDAKWDREYPGHHTFSWSDVSKSLEELISQLSDCYTLVMVEASHLMTPTDLSVLTMDRTDLIYEDGEWKITSSSNDKCIDPIKDITKIVELEIQFKFN
jgi:hypothetical protein